MRVVSKCYGKQEYSQKVKQSDDICKSFVQYIFIKLNAVQGCQTSVSSDDKTFPLRNVLVHQWPVPRILLRSTNGDF